jgi:hypothetical protein
MEHLFEDHSQLGMQYGFWKDMLLGVEVNLPENPYLSCIVYEHLGTKTKAVLSSMMQRRRTHCR